MFAAIRRYTFQSGKVHEVAEQTSSSFVPLLRRMPGFREYYIVDAGNDVAASISVFDSREGAEASIREAAAWVKENLAPLVEAGPEVTAGEVVVEVRAEGAPGYIDLSGVQIRDTARTVRDLYEAFNRRDFDSGAQYILPGAEQINAGSGERFMGPEGYRQNMSRWATAFPDGQVELVNVLASDDVATVEYIGRGTQTGPLVTPAGEIPPTGKRVELRFCDVIRFQAGKVAGLSTYFDSGSLLQQLGVAAHGATA